MSNIKRDKTNRDSPKTPGGISKAFLTPIRRVGLSRNWKNSGSSPFISPLSNSKSANTTPDSESKKRKAPEHEECIPDSDLTNNECNSPISSNTKNVDVNRTPIRNVLSRKMSKTLLLSKKCLEESDGVLPSTLQIESQNTIDDADIKKDSPKSVKVSNPKRASSKSISKSPLKSATNNEINNTVSACEENKLSEVINDKIIIEDSQCNVIKEKDNCNLSKICDNIESKCPNLTKDCIVVIQKKMYKSLHNKNKNDSLNAKPNFANTVSQAVFDSDSDDLPLMNLNKKENEIDEIGKLKDNSNEDDEFQTKKVLKLQDKSTSMGGIKKKRGKNKVQSLIPEKVIKIENTPSSQSSNSIDEDEDDDFEFKKKKTILIKKTYEKAKPVRAKSAGSITQKDIDELTKRIEKKQKMVLVKARTNEIVELKDIIKKWQTGCQNALTEVLELMKKQMPDKQNMKYSEILQMLQIPSNLVLYDSENECFNTPNDESIIMSAYNI